MEFTVTRNDRLDSRSSRSVLERVTGKQEISWSVESYILPRGGSTVPDVDPLIEAALGGGYGDSVSETYNLTDTNALPTLRMARTANGVFREDLFGCYVEEMSITASSGDEPRISFSGGAFNYALTGTGAVHGSSSVTSTSVPLVTGDGVNFMVGSCIDINTGSTVVTGKTAADTLTVKSGTYTNNEAIIPETYGESTGGSPVNGITGSLTLNSVTLPITSFDVTLTNGIKPLADEAFEKGTSDFIAGYRSVKGNISVRARKDFIKSLAARYVATSATASPTFSSVPIQVNLGSTAGLIVAVYIPTAELDFGAIDVPEAEEAILNIPFTGLGNSGGDEFRIAWNQGD
jgi:hypothetical protein